MLGDMDQATPLRAQARRLMRMDGSPRLLARMALFESSWQAQRGDTAGQSLHPRTHCKSL